MEKKYTTAKVIKDIETGEKIFVASDETVDRHGEVIAVDGWKLENFKENPTLLWAHDQKHPKIGNAESIGFKTIDGKKKLVFKPAFHKKDELSRLISELVEDGWINSVSVGFMPLEYDRDTDTITKSELLEISFVNVPANPSARQVAKEKGFDDEIIKTLIPETEEEKKELRLKELEEEIKEANQKIENLEKKITPSQEVIPPVSDKGRNSLPSVKNSRKALKVIYKALEILGRETK